MAVEAKLQGQHTAIGADGQVQGQAALAPAAPASEATPVEPAAPVPETPSAPPTEPAAPAPDPNSPLETAPVEPAAPVEPVPPAEPAPAAELVAVEPTPAAPVEPQPSQEDEMAKRNLALSARELSIVKAERALKQQGEDIQARLRAHDEFQRLAKEDPVKAIESAGISYQELTNRILNDGQPSEGDTVAQMQRKIEELEQNQQKSDDTRLAAENAQNYSNFVGELKNIVDKSRKFPLIAHYNAFDAVAQEVNRYFEATGSILTDEAALAQVETNLQTEVDGLLQLKHIKDAQAGTAAQQPPVTPAPQSEAAPVEPAQPAPPAAPPPPAVVKSTLRNAQQATTGPPAPKVYLDDDESLKAAAAEFPFFVKD